MLNKFSPRPVLAVIVVVVLGLLIPQAGFAGCNAKGKGKDCPPQNPPAEGTSEVFLEGYNVHIGHGESMECDSGDLSTDEGFYGCDVAGNEVHIMTGDMTGYFHNKSREICHTYHHVTHGDEGRMVPDSFSYGWTDDCTDGYCDIEVHIFFSDAAVSESTDGASDRLNVILYGSYAGGLENPFRSLPAEEETSIVIERLRLEFGKPNSRRLAASCDWYSSYYQNEFVSFDTTIPPP